MWTAESEELDRRARRTRIVADGSPLSYGAVIDAWCDDAAFRAFMVAELAATPFRAFFWETPPIKLSTRDQPFEYVTLEGGGLERRPADPSPFEEHLSKLDESASIATFANLGGDATLVVPKPMGEHWAYTHLGVFVRSAPEAQRPALFEAIGKAMRAAVSETSTWLGTSGLGVSWVHVRLDSKPKYYNFEPYLERADP